MQAQGTTAADTYMHKQRMSHTLPVDQVQIYGNYCYAYLVFVNDTALHM